MATRTDKSGRKLVPVAAGMRATFVLAVMVLLVLAGCGCVVGQRASCEPYAADGWNRVNRCMGYGNGRAYCCGSGDVWVNYLSDESCGVCDVVDSCNSYCMGQLGKKNTAAAAAAAGVNVASEPNP